MEPLNIALVLAAAGAAAFAWKQWSGGSQSVNLPTPVPKATATDGVPKAVTDAGDAFAALQVVQARLRDAGVAESEVRKLIDPLAPLLLCDPPTLQAATPAGG